MGKPKSSSAGTHAPERDGRPSEAAGGNEGVATGAPLRVGLQHGLGFGVIWGLWTWLGDGTPLLGAVVWAALAGSLYGLCIAWLTRRYP